MLRELQQGFVRALDGDDALAGQYLFRRGRTQKPPITIYQDSIRAQFIRVLGDIYPVTRQLVGEAFFAWMARCFVADHPSDSHDLTDYGRDFAAFVEAFTPAHSLVYLPDTVRLEWAWHRAFNAPDPEQGNIGSLTHVNQARLPRVRLYLHPTASLLDSSYPIHRIWEMNHAGAPAHMRVSLDEGGVHLVVWRRALDMRIDLLSDAQWYLLHAIADGASMGQLAARWAQTESFSPLLATVLQRGFIYRFECGGG